MQKWLRNQKRRNAAKNMKTNKNQNMSTKLALAALKAGLKIANTDGIAIQTAPKGESFLVLGKAVETFGNLERHEIVGSVVKVGHAIEMRVFGIDNLLAMTKQASTLSRAVGRKVKACLADVSAHIERFQWEVDEAPAAK